ncbi:hypothetical protein [Thalassobaculum sp.]|uniref:hypothetical protein n=1 Tax=Thalassobaculum sp. TaxID=2022740 RepID=UPI0032EB9989
MNGRIPGDVVEALCGAVGHVVVNWAFVEVAVDTCIATIYQNAGGKHIEREIPSAIGRKVKFLRRCIKQIGALSLYRTEGDQLLNRVNAVKDTRHMLVHGCVTGYERENHAFTFAKMDTINNRTRHKLNPSKFTAQQILDDGTECQTLARDLTRFSQRLFEAFPSEDELNNGPSTIGG